MSEDIQLNLTASQVNLLHDAITYAITFQPLSYEEELQLKEIQEQIKDQTDG